MLFETTTINKIIQNKKITLLPVVKDWHLRICDLQRYRLETPGQPEVARRE